MVSSGHINSLLCLTNDPPSGKIYSLGSEKKSGQTCKSLSLSLVQFLSLHYNKVNASLDVIRFLFILLVGCAGLLYEN